jgi:DHA1 family bicyclomycin/chloramphenicol resistance-like MFS transporter
MTELFDSNANTMQLSLTVFLATFGASQLFYGPLSDHYGRRTLLLIGMAVYIVATVFCVLASNVWALLLARAVQGFAIGCGAVVARAISRDMFAGVQLAKVTAYISLAMSLSPALAPALGGYMHLLFGWQSNFILLVGYSSILLLTFYIFLPETLLERNKKERFILQSMKDYHYILTYPLFMLHALGIMINFGSFMSYQTVAPFLLQDKLGLNPAQSGQMILFVALGYAVGTLLNNRLVEKLGINNLMLAGVIICFVSALTMFLIGLSGHMSVVALVAPMSVYTIGSGMFNPGAMSNILTPFPQLAATASACMGAIVTMGAGLLTFIIAVLPDTSQLPLSSLLVVISGLNILILLLCILPGLRAPRQDTAA